MGKINFFCINLDKRTDRWEKCRQQFLKQGVGVKRWPAKPLPENRRFGAWLSHREIIEHAKNNNWDCVGVFEDDIEFLTKNFYKICQESLKELADKDWYILYFWGSFWRWASMKKVGSMKKIFRVRNLQEAHAVIYNKKFFDIYLKKHPDEYSSNITEYYIDNKYRAFDQWYANYVQINYPCYITKSILVVQKDDFSDIENKQVWRSSRSIVTFFLYKYQLWFLVEKLWKYIKHLRVNLGFKK